MIIIISTFVSDAIAIFSSNKIIGATGSFVMILLIAAVYIIICVSLHHNVKRRRISDVTTNTIIINFTNNSSEVACMTTFTAYLANIIIDSGDIGGIIEHVFIMCIWAGILIYIGFKSVRITHRKKFLDGDTDDKAFWKSITTDIIERKSYLRIQGIIDGLRSLYFY